MKQLLSAVLVLFLAGTASANNNYGPNTFLEEGVGGRATGMGGAFVAVADDATAGYWNPAGLSQMDLYIYQVGAQYAALSNDMGESYLAYAFQAPQVGSFEISWLNASANGLEDRDDQGNLLGQSGSSENVFILSYGKKYYSLLKGLSLGASFKILEQELGSYSAVGHGFDVGCLWQPVLYWDHMVGITVQNIFQRLYWNSPAYSVDDGLLTVKIGTALKFLRSDDEIYFNHLVSTVDLEFTEYSRFRLRVGTEYWFLENMGVRAGYNSQEITAGVSYRPQYYEIDYAFHYDLSVLAAHQHRISLLLRFE